MAGEKLAFAIVIIIAGIWIAFYGVPNIPLFYPIWDSSHVLTQTEVQESIVAIFVIFSIFFTALLVRSRV